MKLHILIDSPVTDNQEIAKLARVVAGVEDGWHEWVAPDPNDANLKAYYGQNPLHQELLSKSFVSALAYGSTEGRTITVSMRGGWLAGPDTWPLDDAVMYLQQGLEVLVENARNDGAFFEACWRSLSHPIVTRLGAMRPGLRFSQGGGKAEIRLLILHRVQEALDRRSVPPRIAVLVDGDAKYPGHETSDSRQLKETCAELGFEVHILHKRSIENYVGDVALSHFARDNPDSVRPVAFLMKLSSKQRDHYPIKKGFEGSYDDPDLNTDGERALYQDVAWPSDHRPKIGRLMEYILKNPHLLSRADLASRGAIRELETAATQIDEEA